MEDLETFGYNVMDAKTARFCSKEYGEINQKQSTQENLKRWKKEFKKNLDSAIKDGKFKCLVSIPKDTQPPYVRDISEEKGYGSEIFVEWLKEKGYQVKIDLLWFVIKW